MLGTLQRRVALENGRRGFARALAELFVAQRVGDAEGRHAALPLAEQIAHAAKPQILARDLESVFGLNEHLQPLRNLGTHVAEQDAIGLLRTAADAAAQLVQLRETEPLRMLDRASPSRWHVDPDFDHRRGDEQVDLAVAKAAHDLVALFASGCGRAAAPRGAPRTARCASASNIVVAALRSVFSDSSITG